MAVKAGSNIPRSGLVMLLDAANAKTTLSKKQGSNLLTDPNTWATGTGSTTGYNVNGSASESSRVIVTDDPWGGKSTIWRTVPDATSGADGGWNTSSYAPDVNYRYRASVWVRRHTAGTGGTFYFGVRASPNPIRNDTDAAQSNPYFSYPSQASLTQNQWYLVVAHIHPYNYTGSRHPDSGWYEDGVKITDKSFGNCGQEDLRWDPATTSTYHSTYHFYTTNTASGLEFASPRLDKCDGTEPSIRELTSVGDGKWFDASGNGNHGLFENKSNVTWSSDYGGVFNFDATTSASYVQCATPNLSSSDSTVIVASRYNGATRGRILSGGSNNWLLGHWSSGSEEHYAQGWIHQGTPNDTNWGIHVATRNHGSDLSSYWKNGVKIVSNSTAGAAGPNGFTIGRYAPNNNEYSIAQVAYVVAYNRVLSDREIIDATNALRGRFGI